MGRSEEKFRKKRWGGRGEEGSREGERRSEQHEKEEERRGVREKRLHILMPSHKALESISDNLLTFPLSPNFK
jgi:hypothetical protein